MNIALCGLGKAGRRFVEDSMKTDQFNLLTVLCRDSSNTAGKTVKELTGFNVANDLRVKKISEFCNDEKIDVIVDFSNNPTTFSLLDVCCEYGINLVVCPTNFTEDEISYIKETAVKKNIGVVFAPTLTVGINMLIDFVKKLSFLFDDFDFEIIERHSKNKSKPTKTAEIIANSINKNNVEISSVRLDGCIGIHEVIATNGNECISIIHESLSRSAFVSGAIIAANYICEKKGFYYIEEVYKHMLKTLL